MADEAVVALLDTSAPGWDQAYVLAREAEWKSQTDLVTVWRGPHRPDEHLPRMRLRDIDCETLLVTEKGFWDCLVLEELVEPEVRRLAEEYLQAWADEDLAGTYSYPDPYENDFGSEVWIKATFGDATAVNGETVHGSKAKRPPRGYVITDQGGRVPSSDEAEISRENLYERLPEVVSESLGRPVPEALVHRLIDKLYPKEYIYWSSSGDLEVWVSKRAMKTWLKEQASEEERQRQLSAERRREEHERHQREEEARRQQIREDIAKGKYGAKQDWSPRGRIPGVWDQ